MDRNRLLNLYAGNEDAQTLPPNALMRATPGGPDLSKMPPEQIEAVVRSLMERGTDEAAYQAMAIARAYGVRPPMHRDFSKPPGEVQGILMGPSGRPRPLMREPDYSGFAGGPDDKGRLPSTGILETGPDYEAAYLQQYAPPRRR